MNVAEKIWQEACRLPEPLACEVLDFIGYLGSKHGLHGFQTEHLRQAQQPAMNHVWDNVEDEVWNDL